ncbi:PI-PLC X domain-containing protein 2-like isoform X2 [Limulus polyphemus]|nr:PI-PLC X domain-containing protein 2-like isoform X2 [Limulus polyphemus]XP_022242669.1 PI-PLC X domain-containing protein 2-like isoform X2 [Limulus polyphemus]
MSTYSLPSKRCVLVLACCWAILLPFAHFDIPAECSIPKRGSLRVFLTVSSLVSTSPSGDITERQLELNWLGGTRNEGDRVMLFDRDPKQSLERSLVMIDPLLHVSGYYKTNVQFPHLNFASHNLTTNCLGFWIAYLRQDKVLASSCLRARPYWMKENKEWIKDIPLVNLMIPGTHNAGSYQRYKGSESEKVFIRYLYNQEESVFNQLAYGIRFLDLRVGYYPGTTEKFWINHRLFSVNNTLATVLQDVASFVWSTEEIILLDIHNFPTGFTNRPDIHQRLIIKLLEYLGHFMIPRNVGHNATLGTLWNAQKRVLVSYNSDYYVSSQLLWPGVTHIWGNKQTVGSLKSFFENSFRQLETSYLSSAMAELTSTIANFLIEPLKGHRGMAHDVNRQVTIWFRDLWWWSCNIVSTDYFLGNNIIDVSIESNIKKALCRKEQKLKFQRRV